MHIFLTILGVIGKVLGILLLLILLVLLLVLLVPVIYEAAFRRDTSGTMDGRFTVSWLLKLIRAEGTVNLKREVSGQVYVAGFKVKTFGTAPSASEDKDSSGDDTEVDEVLEAFEEDDEPTAPPEPDGDTAPASGEETTSETIADTAPAPEEENTSETTSDTVPASEEGSSEKPAHIPQETETYSGNGNTGRKRRASAWTDGSWWENLEDRVTKLADSFEKRTEELERWLSDSNKAAVMHLLRRIMILIRHYRPRRLEGYLHYGTGMPDMTGYATGMLMMLLPAGAEQYDLQPEFTDKCLDTDTVMMGHIRAIHLLIAVVVMLADRNFRKLLRMIFKARKGG